MALRRPLVERLLAPVIFEAETGCWTRQGHSVGGYTQVAVGGAQSKHLRAHRASYEIFVGPIPAGLQIDHLCRNTRCINPAHLEPVTARENTMRSTSFAAVNAAKTHCVHGHSLADAYINAKTGKRRCRVCSAVRQARWRASHREHRRAWERAAYAKKRAAA